MVICAETNRFKGKVPEKNMREMENFKLLEKDVLYWYVMETWMGRRYLSQKTTISKEKYYNFWEEGGSSQGRLETNLTTLIICAPASDFYLDASEEIKGHQIIKKAIPDPVVLKPVKDGYLIITAWGIEANDPEVRNAHHN